MSTSEAPRKPFREWTQAEKNQAFEIFMLKSKVGALSDAETLGAQEAGAFAALMSNMPFEPSERSHLALLIRKMCARNAITLWLDKLNKYLVEVDKLPEIDRFQAVVAFIQIWIEASVVEEDKELPEIRDAVMKFFAHQQARVNGEAHIRGA